MGCDQWSRFSFLIEIGRWKLLGVGGKSPKRPKKAPEGQTTDLTGSSWKPTIVQKRAKVTDAFWPKIVRIRDAK